MKKSILLIAGVLVTFLACKKEKTSPDPSIEDSTNTIPTNSTADFTISASDINYPIGTTWAYKGTTVDEHYYNNNPGSNTSYTTTDTYTVTVVRDTLISGCIIGKILHYSAIGFDDVNTYIREVKYYEPADLKWHSIIYEKYNGGAEVSGCLGINLPLTANSIWQNTHSAHPPLAFDSCYSKGFENVSCGMGNIKCIKFNDKFETNTYWYNNIYGRVKTYTEHFQVINPTEATGKFITTELTSYHN